MMSSQVHKDKLVEALRVIAGDDPRWPNGYQYPRELAEFTLHPERVHVATEEP